MMKRGRKRRLTSIGPSSSKRTMELPKKGSTAAAKQQQDVSKTDEKIVEFEKLIENISLEDSKGAFLFDTFEPFGGENDDEQLDIPDIMPMLEDSEPPEDSEEEDEQGRTDYEVERILLKRNESFYYFVKWEGYKLNQGTWEPPWNLTGCEKVLKTFEDRKMLCFGIYKSMLNKDEYGGFIDTWVNGILTTTLIECCVLEDILTKYCKRNKFGNLCVENWTRSIDCYPDITFLPENQFSDEAKKLLSSVDPPKVLCSCKACGKKDENCPCIKRGRTIPLMLFRTHWYGWGIRTLVDIPINKFVDEYVGRIKLHHECRNIKDPTYLFDIDSDEDETVFVVDATEEGNASRFINHSCDPNLEVVLVKGLYNHRGYARVTFFSVKQIKAGDELTFNYFKHEPDLSLVDDTTPKCYCGYELCRKYLI
uniref:Histone-lysine N-methyltransferase n=1 Tax=Panagrolaimus sp. ES5 TaxID=591445 RepID=A0AC34F996_9BILA